MLIASFLLSDTGRRRNMRTFAGVKKVLFIAFLIGGLSLDSFSDAFASQCQNNVANFTAELQQPFNIDRFVRGWGPMRNTLQLNNELLNCLDNSVGLDWQRQRIIAAADFWIKQKLNYCHHYLPDYPTPLSLRNVGYNKGGYCSAAKDIMPGSPYYQQQVRWNYSGLGAETMGNWLNNTMWYGMDCSNYTTFLYNFAFGLMFSSKTEYQAGQRADPMQYDLSPNQQSEDNVLDNPKAAGLLVCSDNTLEVQHSCDGHGGYLSAIDSSGTKHRGSITAKNLAALPLYPGDLLFISASRPDAVNPSAVVHVVMWTGKQVGYGSNDIHPDQIAPNSLCPQKDWMPRVGDWVITDSHYQGADYRVLTSCYYLNNLWGVRRVIY
ncbi:hypothetical protein [Legionella shakespearei]|nr:hypothetical protein [Legionella shakespearei]